MYQILGHWVTCGVVMVSLVSQASPFTQLQIKECQGLLDSKTPVITQALDGVRILDSGEISYQVHSGYRPREMTLPLIAQVLRANPLDKVMIVTPGNTLYDGTRHNLGFHFADHLVTQEGFLGLTQEGLKSADFPRTEAVEIFYDNSDQRSGHQLFHSEPVFFRTDSGEIFLKEIAGKLVILVRAIGDYNETGDFVVPLMETIGIQPANLIVAQDNMEVAKLEILTTPPAPINANGNNAIFSLNRSLALAMLPSLEALIRSNVTFGGAINNGDWLAFEEQFRQAAHELKESWAFRNTEAVAGPIRKFLTSVVKKRILEEEKREVTGANKTLRQQRGHLMRQIKGNKNLEEREKKRLEQELAEFDFAHFSRFTAEKQAIAELDAAYEALTKNVEALIVEKMSYARLSIGIGRPADGNNVAFVLGEFDPEQYNQQFFEQVTEALMKAINRPE